MTSTVVLKFGSSVLRSAHDLPVALHEIYAHRRGGSRVVAVVSAFAGVTDRLFAAGAVSGLEGHALAEFVGAGERDSARALTAALDEAGIPAACLGPQALGLLAQGNALDATPIELGVALRTALDATPVIVVPGFIAVDARGRSVLLGRGGSDLTALFIAQRLGARCRLLKDVDGVYDHDPAAGEPARRYATLSWRRALDVGGELVQPRAIRFAQSRQFEFEVAGTANGCGTLVGARGDRFVGAPTQARDPLAIVLLGLGTVGLGVYRHLAARPDLFAVRRIVVRDRTKVRDFPVPDSLLSTNPWDAINEPAEIVVEALGGTDPASDLIHAALLRDRTVISANKAAVDAGWPQLARFATGSDAKLRYSAAVGGAVPVLEALETLTSPLRSVRAVINGTCNFILEALETGLPFDAALATAHERGFAEADASADVEGHDAARKLSLVSRHAFGGAPPLEFAVTGITHIEAQALRAARARRKRLRLVAECQRDNERLSARVHPVEIAEDDFLAQARGEENRVELHTADGAVLRLSGKGAGRWPTAASVMGDLYAVVRVRFARCIDTPANSPPSVAAIS
jgi:homoserine dehydrogenase